MTLAEALRQRADLQKRISQLQHRVKAAARYQEGSLPEENAAALLSEAQEAITAVKVLVQRINATNAATQLDENMTLTGAIAARDALHAERNFLTEAAEAAAGTQETMLWGRRRVSELREIAALDVPALRQEADRLAAAHRSLDVRIQQANWATELL